MIKPVYTENSQKWLFIAISRKILRRKILFLRSFKQQCDKFTRLISLKLPFTKVQH